MRLPLDHGCIYLIGFMGAGKSTVGRRLAQKIGWKFIDMDEVIENREGRSIASVFRDGGEPHFRAVERQCLRDISLSKHVVIATGGGAFVDGENRSIMESTGLTVWLKVSFDKVVDRVKITDTRPMFGDNEQAKRLLETREPYYALAKVHVSTDDITPASVADEILRVIQAL